MFHKKGYCKFINVCWGILFAFFETKPCSQGLIFAVSSGLVTYSSTRTYMNYVCRYLFLRFEDDCEFHQINPSQRLLNFQYMYMKVPL